VTFTEVAGEAGLDFFEVHFEMLDAKDVDAIVDPRLDPRVDPSVDA